MLSDKGFDLWADGYDRDVGLSDETHSYPFAGYREVLGRIYATIMERPHAVVLDVGFGTGTLLCKLCENGCTVYGQDFSERMLALAKAKAPGAQLYAGDFSEGLCAPLRQKTYDFIVSTYALHHLSDAQKIGFLRGLEALLNPGGAILIGDVAFSSRKDLARCRAEAGDKWDDEEYYFIFDELRAALPDLRFTPVSFCAGILTLTKPEG